MLVHIVSFGHFVYYYTRNARVIRVHAVRFFRNRKRFGYTARSRTTEARCISPSPPIGGERSAIPKIRQDKRFHNCRRAPGLRTVIIRVSKPRRVTRTYIIYVRNEVFAVRADKRAGF